MSGRDGEVNGQRQLLCKCQPLRVCPDWSLGKMHWTQLALHWDFMKRDNMS